MVEAPKSAAAAAAPAEARRLKTKCFEKLKRNLKLSKLFSFLQI